MTTEEKLKHFQEICMTDAREKSAKILDDYAKLLIRPMRSIQRMPGSGRKCRKEAETEKLRA